MARVFIAGPNFSGRSALLKARLGRPGFFVGPYAEAALSGLASTVADEVAIYRDASTTHTAFAPLDFAGLSRRKPPTLSGGEQVLLALHCFSQSRYRAIGLDTALEQLDPAHGAAALAFLSHGDFDALLIDNRIALPPGWSEIAATEASNAFACDPGAAVADLAPRAAPAIAIHGLSFRYRAGNEIFRGFDLALAPGRVYRLLGPNGAGKSTLFKLLAGVLAPDAGTVTLDAAPYAPWRSGNRVFALATQNPDHQWCGATLAEDLARRRAALRRLGVGPLPDDDTLAALAARLGVGNFDQHLYELPLAARKRLSWLWPFAGVMPWLMLDEPSIGQDRATRAALAAALQRLCGLGYGVVVVTHDDGFAGLMPHAVLRIAEKTVHVTGS